MKWRIEQERGAGHNLDIADIDGDGVQEVICGGICYNGDGSMRWEAEPFGHTDISKPAKGFLINKAIRSYFLKPVIRKKDKLWDMDQMYD